MIHVVIQRNKSQWPIRWAIFLNTVANAFLCIVSMMLTSFCVMVLFNFIQLKCTSMADGVDLFIHYLVGLQCCSIFFFFLSVYRYLSDVNLNKKNKRIFSFFSYFMKSFHAGPRLLERKKLINSQLLRKTINLPKIVNKRKVKKIMTAIWRIPPEKHDILPLAQVCISNLLDIGNRKRRQCKQKLETKKLTVYF